MRAFVNFDLWLIRIRRSSRYRFGIGLNKDERQFIRNLLRDPLGVDDVPDIEMGLPRHERRIGDAANLCLGFPEAQDTFDSDHARPVILMPGSGSIVAAGRNPAALDKDSCSVRKHHWNQSKISLLVFVILFPNN